MEAIQYIGADVLDETQKADLDKLSTEYYDRIQRGLKNITSLKIHVKKHTKGGRGKFSIHLTVIAPTRVFECSASDWDFAKTLHMVFNEMQNQIEHYFHKDTKFYEHKG